MGARSFTKPPDLETAPLPRVGEPAPEPPGPPWEAPGQVVCFLRHAGCPFAEATLKHLREEHRRHPAITAVAVGHAPPAPAQAWRSAIGGAEGVVCIDDPSRSTYARWGLGLTNLRHFSGADSLMGVVSLLGSGTRNRRAAGTRWQGAGTFAVDGKGIVRWVHVAGHAGDLPDLAAAFASLGEGS